MGRFPTAGLLAFICAVALVAPVVAWAEACSGGAPNNVCERIVPPSTAGAAFEPALPASAEKVSTEVLDAVDSVTLFANHEGASPDALTTQSVRVNRAGEIQVYVILTEFQPEYVARVEALGVRVELTLPEFRLIQAWVPATLVEVVAALDFVTEVRPPGYAMPKAGARLTAGDTLLRAETARSTFGITGTGVKVGVISDGVDHLSHSVATGDLPTGVQVLKNSGGDEGTAMLEIVHDLAPGAALAFYGPTTSADMVAGINALAAAGARVVVDDLLFFDEPKFEDGMIAQTARNFATGGRVYVTAAGNQAQRHYRSIYNRLPGSIPGTSYAAVHNYSSSIVDPGNTFVLPNGCSVRAILQWNNRNGAAADDFDLLLARSSDSLLLAYSINIQSGTQNAYERLFYTNTTGAPMVVFLAVTEWARSSPASSLVLDYFIYPTCKVEMEYVTSADSVIGHSAVNEALSVAALNASTPTQAALYSSRGPGSISFPTVEARGVPNISGIDCVDTEAGAAGFFPQPFCGTSAAAPHVAGIAALLIALDPSLTSQQLRDTLTGTAIDLGSAGFDYTYGFGRVDALLALQAAAPTRTLTVTKAGAGVGTVTSSPAGINCGSTCSVGFRSGTTVVLTATPAIGSTFAGWSGACSGMGSCTLVVTGTTNVTATFLPNPVASLRISGPDAVAENTATTYTATATFSDGASAVVTPTWSVGAPASISLGGVLTVGNLANTTTVTITASYTSGTTATATKVVTIQDANQGLGAIVVTATYNGAPLTDVPVAFTLSRGGDTITWGTLVPKTFADRTPGLWTISAVGGGPANTAVTVSPSSSQALGSGAVITFTLNYVSLGTPRPDLIVTVANGPDAALAGTPASLAPEFVEVKNAGNATVGTFRVGFYWSTDPILSGDDVFAGSCAIGGLTINQVGRCGAEGPAVTLTVPASLTGGTYYLITVADDQNAIIESNELNNWKADAAGTVVTEPDPVPTVTRLDPSSAIAGTAGVTVMVTGTNFVSRSVVHVNGTARTTTFVSATRLTAALTASDLATSGLLAVRVVTTAPGGGTSNAATFIVAPAGPMWSMHGHDRSHTGRSRANGPVRGDTKWTFGLPATIADNASPVVAPDGSVYVSSETGISAVTPTGDLKWQRSAGIGATRSAPAVADDGTVYVASASVDDNGLLALDPATGNTLWSYPIGRGTSGAPTIGGDGTIYVPSMQANGRSAMNAINPDGTSKWLWDSNSTCAIESSPAIDASGNVYLHHNCLGLVSLDSAGKLRWARESEFAGDPGNAPSIGPDGTVYLGFYAIEPESGVIKWRASGVPTGRSSRGSAAVSVDGTTTYRGDNTGVFYAVDRAGAVRWQFNTGISGPIRGSPALAANGVVYFTQDRPAAPGPSDSGFVHALRAADGTLLWRLPIGWSSSSPAIASDGTVYAVGTGPSGGSAILYPFPCHDGLCTAGPLLTLDRATAPLNGPVTVTFANGPGAHGEWLGVYPAGSSTYVDWQWTNGGQTTIQGRAAGALTFPTGGLALAAGDYVVRWWGANGALLASSGTLTLADIPSAPTLTSLQPASVVAGSAAFTLRALGSGFRTTSVIRIGGVARTTTFVSAGELTTSIAASEVASTGTLSVTVVTPALSGQGGGESGAQTLTITPPPPAPTLTDISPTSITARNTPLALTVTGTNYVSNSVVQVNGAARPTTFVSSTELTATLPVSDVGAAATLSVTVFTPAPGGGTSSAATLTVIGPTLSLDRTTAPLAGPVAVTFANGPGVPGEWLGVYPSGTPGGPYADWQWTGGGQAGVRAAAGGTLTFPTGGRALDAGTYVVRWWAANGALLAQSATLTLADIPPAPTVTSLEPASVVAGSPAFTLRVRGTGFRPTTVVQIGGTDRATTVTSSTELATSIAASEVASLGTLGVTARTPAVGGQGGGTSAALTLAIVAPPAAPTLTSISPTSVTAGGGPVTLTVTGTNYVGTSVIRINGIARPTTLVSTTQLTTILAPADVSTGGTLSVTVFTPAPGGGTSTAATFTVVGPTLTLDRTTAPLNGPIVSTLANGPGRAGEWLGLYRLGTSGMGGYSDWQWTGGGQGAVQAAASGTLTWPTGGRALLADSYVLRWWSVTGTLLAQSATLTLADIPPAPALTSLQPDSVVAGSAAFTLRALGSGFRATSVMRIAGAARVTTFVSSGELTTTVAASEISATGTLSVTVFTPAVGGQGGGESSATTLTIAAPPAAPTLTSISPTSIVVGAAGATITLTGTNYVATSVGQVNGSPRPTTVLSATQLRLTLTAADVATARALALTVTTPAPGGGTSSAINLTVVGPTLSLDRTAAPLNGPVVVTLANGPGLRGEWLGVYPAGSTGVGGFADWQWTSGGHAGPQGTANGTLTFPTGGRVLPAGSYVVRWWATSSALLAESATFTLLDVPPPPTLTSLEPPTVVAGSAAFTLRARGTGYRANSVMQIGGIDRTTTFVSTTELTTSIAASEVASVGTLTVTVTTPAVSGQGGGTSSAATLTITPPPPVPTLTSISPTSVSVGVVGATVTATGTNFVTTSVLHVNGSARPTTLLSATQLRAPLLAADVSTGGTLSVTVVTPAPGGGTSSAATLTVVGPTVTLDRTTAPLSGPVAVSFANGPGVRGEWLALYPSSAPAGPYADWQWTSGGHGNAQPAASGTLTFPTGGLALPAGTYVVRWWAASGALLAQSATLTLVDIPPAPAITSLEPASVVAGSAGFTLRVRGTGYRTTSLIRIGGSDRTTAFVSATELTTSIAASEIASEGTLSVTVATPAVGGQGGGTSSAATLPITGPPTLTLDRTTAPLNGPIVSTFANGPGRPGEWLGLYRAGTSGMGGYNDWQWTGGGQSGVRAAASGALTWPTGGLALAPDTYVLRWWSTTGALLAQSGAFTLADIPPAPTISSLEPASVVAGSAAFTLRVLGTGYRTASAIRIGGGDRTTTFVSSTELTTPVAASEVASVGTLSVTVTTPALGGQGGGTSAAATLTIVAPPAAPTLTSIAPTSVGVGATGATVTATGANYVSTSVVHVNGSARPTTFVSATQLTALLAPGDVSAGGTLNVTVFTPAPGGGTSEARTLTVVGPTLTLDRTTAPLTGPVVSTFANGPGRPGEWLALYRVESTAPGAYVDWQWTSGGQSNAQGATGGTLTWPTPGRPLSAGSYVIRWWSTATTLLAQSATLTLADIPPAPTIASLDPPTVVAGGAAFTLHVRGTGYRTTSVIRIGGSNHTTAFLSPTELTTTIAAAEIAEVGTLSVTVTTPALGGEGGGTSSAAMLTIASPPTLTVDRTTALLTGPIVVTIANGPGLPGEWIAIYPVGTVGMGGYVDWQWSNGGQGAIVGTTEGTLTFPTGGRALAAGTYVVRWWARDGRLLAESVSITLSATTSGVPLRVAFALAR